MSNIFIKKIIDKILAIILFLICLTYLIIIVLNTIAYFKYTDVPIDIVEEDKELISKVVDAKGKDIIIILDTFEKMDENDEFPHGGSVNYYFNRYIKNELKKEMDVLPILLSSPKHTRADLELILYENKNVHDYNRVIKNVYSLETYIKFIKEKNPNSKIVLSMSFVRFFINDKIINLSKKYNFHIAQAYFNSYKPDQWLWMIHHYLFMNKKDVLIVSNGRLNPILSAGKNINTNDIDFNSNGYRNEILKIFDGFEFNEDFIKSRFYLNNNPFYSTSYLTPILAYEYYLNPKSNLKRK